VNLSGKEEEAFFQSAKGLVRVVELLAVVIYGGCNCEKCLHACSKVDRVGLVCFVFAGNQEQWRKINTKVG